MYWSWPLQWHHLLKRLNLIINSKFIYLCVPFSALRHQGAAPLRDWAVSETGPRTSTSTSEATDLLHWTKTLHWGPSLEITRSDRLWRSVVFVSFRWFEGFDWEGLCKNTLKAPVIPKVRRFVCGILLFCDEAVSKGPDSFVDFFLVLQVKHPSDSSVCGDYTVDAAELHTHWEDFWRCASCEQSGWTKSVWQFFITHRFSPHE